MISLSLSLFVLRQFSSLARVRRFPTSAMPPQHTILGRLFLQTPLFYRVLYFLLPSLNRSPYPPLPLPRYTQTFPQIDTSIPCLQRHPTHPSHHHHLRPVQLLHVLPLHRPRFAPIYQHLLHAHPINLSLQPQRSPPPLQNRSPLIELCPRTPNSSNRCISRPPSCSDHITQVTKLIHPFYHTSLPPIYHQLLPFLPYPSRLSTHNTLWALKLWIPLQFSLDPGTSLVHPLLTLPTSR